ncbi:TetR/AcrR family transcriptional regulator [Nocardia sp. NPDC050712]|uniref:TetR/AcrR family transcriptional regulator n=1 Tax=Nocardia sp. NPDC050712 TaxID=3155518 RepID=UPI00340FEF86
MKVSRSYHHGDLREQLLQRAEQTLRETGVDQLSLRQLARDVGVTHNAPSRHFRDKQALLDALAQSGFERLGAAFRTSDADLPFVERFHRLARTYLDFAVDNPALLTLMFARKHSPTAGAEMAAATALAFAVPVTLTAEAQTRGEIVAGDPLRIAMSVAVSLQGLASFVISGMVTPDAAEQLLNEVVTNLTQGLLPRTT